jgi:hypothetical protein
MRQSVVSVSGVFVMIKRLSHVCLTIGLSILTLGALAQVSSPGLSQPVPQSASQSALQPATQSRSQTAAQAPTPKLPYQPFESMFELPAGVLQALALETKQKELLDKAHIARRQLWSAMRNARMQEYAALTKELNKDNFDPKEVISIRKKIRTAADKRMDEVQSVWMDFWESLDATQRKTLVSYMKQQHINNAKLSQQRDSLERAANTPAKTK